MRQEVVTNKKFNNNYIKVIGNEILSRKSEPIQGFVVILVRLTVNAFYKKCKSKLSKFYEFLYFRKL